MFKVTIKENSPLDKIGKRIKKVDARQQAIDIAAAATVGMMIFVGGICLLTIVDGLQSDDEESDENENEEVEF